MKIGPKSHVIAIYICDVYTLRARRYGKPRERAGLDRGYVVLELAGYRTVQSVPMFVFHELERAGVKRLGGKRHRFKYRSDVREALARAER